MSSDESGLSATVLGAFEGSVAVLLTILAGFVSAHLGLIDHPTTKKVSNLCSELFLPCLLVVQMGPELTPQMFRTVWIIPVWGFASTVLAHGLGWLGKAAFRLPNWTIVAAGRANSSALPLLLLESLASTGVLDNLKRDGESRAEILSRAKSLVLLNAVVQQVFTFAIGPSILQKDKAPTKKDALLPGPGPRGRPTIQDAEHVGLLEDHDGQDEEDEGADGLEVPFRQLVETPDVHWPKRFQWAEKPLKTVGGLFNPPVIGGLVALLFGMTPALRSAFLVEDGMFYTSITSAVSNLGHLFVALQMFTVGAELQQVPSANPHVGATTFVLFIRYLLMPATSIGLVWATANRGWYDNDPLVWFLLVIIPAGPSAMILANLAEFVGVDQGPISGYLTIAYLLSPLIALPCTAALAIVQKVSS